MARGAHITTLVIPGRTEGADPESIAPVFAMHRMHGSYGFRARALARAPRNDDGTFVVNPSAGGGPVATSGAGGAGASKRQP
jgi:hypothetical protein